MATAEDAKLILQLYELRREEAMRKARAFVTGPDFMPTSAKDLMDMVMSDPQKSAWFRQASSYWDMAAALVNHGTIDASLFYDTNGEYLAVWAKIGDLVPELRGIFGPQYMKNLEQLIANQPDGARRIQMFRERYQKIAELRGAQPS
ncbi:MAG TPA: hypothetical protein VFZ34_17420 [Blastocatellia bacterium]|nr:hypothetical protein [Blastocatellia bacterium]